MENLDWTGPFRGVIFFGRWWWWWGGVVLFFLVSEKITFLTFPQQAIFFSFGGERGVVLYRLYSSLLFVGFGRSVCLTAVKLHLKVEENNRSGCYVITKTCPVSYSLSFCRGLKSKEPFPSL